MKEESYKKNPYVSAYLDAHKEMNIAMQKNPQISERELRGIASKARVSATKCHQQLGMRIHKASYREIVTMKIKRILSRIFNPLRL